MPELLRLTDLKVEAVGSDGGSSPILRGVDLALSDEERVALVGESGCGKTVTALSILNLLPDPPLRRCGGGLFFEGKDLDSFSKEHWRRLRGGEIAMIFQEALTSLNPSLRAGDQVVEAVLAHRGLGIHEAREEAIRLFRETGLPDPIRVASQFPHQLSGGMCQRVMIAMALAGQPKLLIADEPTTALDVTVQAQILDLLREESEKRHLAMLFVTHDLSLTLGFCHTVAVFYAGRVVERGPTAQVFETPAHPYTRGLIACQPSRALAGQPVPTLAGSPPAPGSIGAGCSFADRCPRAQDLCRRQDPPETEIQPGRSTRCFFPFVP